MQMARTGAAARRPSTSVATNNDHVLTSLSVAPIAALQRNHPRADVAVLPEFVIIGPLFSDRAAFTSDARAESPERELPAGVDDVAL